MFVVSVQELTNAGALLKLFNLIKNENKGLRKETCWTISNITAGSVQNIEDVFKQGLIQSLIKVMGF